MFSLMRSAGAGGLAGSRRRCEVQGAKCRARMKVLPVWLLNVRWEGEIYLFAINGQTGKVCGRLPASKKKAMAFFAKLAVPLSIAGAALAFILV